MMLATPLAALGFATVGGLVALYCFRRKSPPRRVSSLFLWPAPTTEAASAQRRDKLRLPPIFFLELFGLAALVTAALTPLMHRHTAGDLLIVLDTSPSMSASVAGGSPAERAEALVAEERKRGWQSVRVREAASDDEVATELAAAQKRIVPGDEILVLTDHAPPHPEDTLPPVRWRSLGTPAPNRSVSAVRRTRVGSDTDSILVVLRSFGASASTECELRLHGGEYEMSFKPDFDADGCARVVAEVPSAAGDIAVSLSPADALPVDNAAVVPPPSVPSMRVALSVTNVPFASAVRHALDATGFVSGYGAKDAMVVVTDADRVRPDGDPFEIRFLPAGGAPIVGPAWVDPSEGLMEGVSIDGLFRRACLQPLPGRVVAFVGTNAVMSVSSNGFAVAASNPSAPFFSSPSFPALMQNLLQAAWESTPMGDPALARPSGVLSDTESDLTGCIDASFGGPAPIPESALRTRSAAWIFGLLAFVALAAHAVLTKRRESAVFAALALLALARPAFTLRERSGTLIVVADRSASMSREALADQADILKEISDSRPGKSSLGVVAFGASPILDRAPGQEPASSFSALPDADGSDIAAALEFAESLPEEGADARILLLTDGLATGAEPTGARFPVDAIEQLRPSTGDVAVDRIDAPGEVSPREAILISAMVFADYAVTSRYELACGGRVVASGVRAFGAGMTPLVFRDFAGAPGVRRYRLEVEASPDDPRPENNAAEFLVRIDGMLPVAAVCEGGGDGLAAALRDCGVDAVAVASADFKVDAASLASYSGVILENVPIKSLPGDADANLAAWVEHLGGGLAMTGGESSFGPGGWYRSDVEALLPVTLELRKEHRKYSLALAIVMDRSGSMAMMADGGRTKMDLANIGANGAVEMLGPMDQAAVIAVDSAPHIVLPMQSAQQARRQSGKILGIQSMGGGIFVNEGLVAGLRELEKADTALKHLILFADAQDSEEPGDYRALLSKAAAAGVTVSVIGLGHESDCDAELLRDIAKVGGGECYFEDNAAEIPRLFMQDTFMSAKTAMVTNPTPLNVLAPMRLLSDAFPASVPPTGGYNLTYARPEGEIAIRCIDDDSSPFLATRRAGSGRTLAFAGELRGAHGGDFLTDPAITGELLGSIGRFVAGDRTKATSGFMVCQRRVPGGIDVAAYADTEDDASAIANSGLAAVAVRMRDGETPRGDAFRLAWRSADALSAFVPVRGGETVIVSVELPDGSSKVLPPVCEPYSPEHRVDSGDGRRVIERIVRGSGGEIRASVAGIWDTLATTPVRRELAPWIYLLAAFAFLAAIAVRRMGFHPKFDLRNFKLPRRTRREEPKRPAKPVQRQPVEPVKSTTEPAKPSAFERAKRRARMG